MRINTKTIGTLGLAAVVLLIIALALFGTLNAGFSFLNDFISKLGAKGEPNALWFNLIGFILVGTLLFVFGLLYGMALKDKLLAALLSLFGLGFALTAVPIDLASSETAISKAHIAIVSFGLAFWLFGLSRMGYNKQLEKGVRNRANFAAILLVTAMIGFVLGLWSMPVTHRLVFGVVFGWTAITSLQLLSQKRESLV
ncbi:MAG: hypothetical protein Roseis2KO_40660 [Roseivirga sp.]